MAVDARSIITVKKKEDCTITGEASRLRPKKCKAVIQSKLMYYAFVTA
jgi:hypothetical protein